MFVMRALTMIIWKEVYQDLKLLGKVILFPLFLIATIGFIALGIVETIAIDSIVLLLALFSKSNSVKEVFKFYWYD